MTLDSADRDRFLTAALAAARRAGAIHRSFFRAPDLAVELKADASPVTVSDRLAEEALREVLRRHTPELGLLGEELGAEGDGRDRWVLDPLDGTKNFVAGLPWFAVLIALELDGKRVLGLVHAPALEPAPSGQTWWAARGHGAWMGPGTDTGKRQDQRLAVSEVAELSQVFLAHGGLKRIQQQGLWPQLTELVAKTSRTRGFGDWWGHMLVAEGRCDAMFEAAVALHDVAPVEVIVEEAGGAFLTRARQPLSAAFHDAVLSANARVAEPIAAVLGW